MPDPTSERLASLRQLSKSALCDLWKHVFEVPPPSPSRRDFMIPILGYRIQEQVLGGALSSDSHRRLRQLACKFAADPNSAVSSEPSIKPGTRLVREWKGHVHVVHVEEKGYEYEGARYKSLSQIARLITRTRWSGPLFFGLKDKKKVITVGTHER